MPAGWLKAAKAAGDKDRERKIKRAQKYLGCRNKQSSPAPTAACLRRW
jgi:hypothetical protein